MRTAFAACTLLPPQVDSVMWTHIPTAAEEKMYPGLTKLVVELMHHKCGDRCGGAPTDGRDRARCKCCWGFPQRSVHRTHPTKEGKWVTRRGVDDCRVVAYNPVLLLLTRRHCNFIITSGTAAISYLFSYTLKGDATIR